MSVSWSATKQPPKPHKTSKPPLKRHSLNEVKTRVVAQMGVTSMDLCNDPVQLAAAIRDTILSFKVPKPSELFRRPAVGHRGKPVPGWEDLRIYAVAKCLDCGGPYLSNILRGRQPMPGGILRDLSRVLGWPDLYILARVQKAAEIARQLKAAERDW